jgi:prolyl-tRNA synthetase
MWGWVKKGIPLRVEVGPRDLASGSVFVARRDRGDKQSLPRDAFVSSVPALLQEIQDGLLARARTRLTEHTRTIDDKDELYAFFTPKNTEQPEIHGGFALAHWSGDPAIETRLKDDLGVTLRCIPFTHDGPGRCPFSGAPSPQRVVWAKAY